MSRWACGCECMECASARPIAWVARFPDDYIATPETYDALCDEIEIELHNAAVLA